MSFCSDAEGEESSISEETLEELTMRHMKRSGFLAQIKGEISKYMFEITKAKIQTYVSG